MQGNVVTDAMPRDAQRPTDAWGHPVAQGSPKKRREKRPSRTWNPRQESLSSLRKEAEREGLLPWLEARDALLRGEVLPCPLEHPDAVPWEAFRADGYVACPWVGCPMHLYLDEKTTPAHRGPNGSVRTRWPDVSPSEIPRCCALDVARRVASGEDEVLAIDAAGYFGLTHQGLTNIEDLALAKLTAEFRRLGVGVEDLLPPDAPPSWLDLITAGGGVSLSVAERSTVRRAHAEMLGAAAQPFNRAPVFAAVRAGSWGRLFRELRTRRG